jgi:prephenate dehydrogenase
MGFTITIIGLGLMGSSFARAIRGFRDARLLGVDTDASSRQSVLCAGWVDEAYEDAKEAVRQSDVSVFATYPRTAIDGLRALAADFKPGSVVTDLCGVKRPLVQAAQSLPDHVSFVGGHPMAGKEAWGHENAAGELFYGANYILTPVCAREEAVTLIQEMVAYIGAHVTVCTPETHDRMIAYTSQLAHILASALANTPDYLDSAGYEGGSFRDLTRVATLNAHMWAELFVLNQDALCGCLDTLIDNLQCLRGRISRKEEADIAYALFDSSRQKKRYLEKLKDQASSRRPQP